MEAALGFEPRMKDLQSSALPLGYAATLNFYKDGAENGIRTRDPRLGKAMLYHWAISAKKPGAETQNWTGDTWIFSPLLYRLSYLGI